MKLQLEQARKLVEVMKRGDCWCEMAVGNPMVTGHAIFCEEARRFIEGHEICKGCGREIDPTTCGCGDPIKAHETGFAYNHPGIPMGCICHVGNKGTKVPS